MSLSIDPLSAGRQTHHEASTTTNHNIGTTHLHIRVGWGRRCVPGIDVCKGPHYWELQSKLNRAAPANKQQVLGYPDVRRSVGTGTHNSWYAPCLQVTSYIRFFAASWCTSCQACVETSHAELPTHWSVLSIRMDAEVFVVLGPTLVSDSQFWSEIKCLWFHIYFTDTLRRATC